MDVYRQRNTLHFIQCSNDRDACLAQAGDTRITMLFVPAFTGEREVPQAVLNQRLEQEAPHFMRTLVDLEIPDPEGRLRVPFISTAGKERYEDFQKSALDIFLEEHCTYWPGKVIKWKDFYGQFLKACPADDPRGIAYWTIRRVSGDLPEMYPTGRIGQESGFYVGNMVLDCKGKPAHADLTQQPYIRTKSRRLVLDPGYTTP
jgi:hypothetical protein